jgi:hypothetical protein
MPAHHEIEATIDEYLSPVSIDDKQPLFQSVTWQKNWESLTPKY